MHHQILNYTQAKNQKSTLIQKMPSRTLLEISSAHQDFLKKYLKREDFPSENTSHRQRTTSFYFMSSPINIYDSSQCNDSEDIHTSSTESSMCNCQNQLAHFNWNGIPREDLSELCKQTLGIVSSKNGK